MNQKIIETGVQILETVGPHLKEQFFKAVEKIGIWVEGKLNGIDWEEKIDVFFSNWPTSTIPENVKITKVKKENLNKEDLIEIARQNIVPNSNEVLALLDDKRENADFIYLAYAKDQEIIPQESNNFVIIVVKALAKEVRTLFNGHELIILK